MKITDKVLFLFALVIVAGIGVGCLVKGINGAVMVAVVGSVTAIASYLGAKSGTKERMKDAR